MEIDQGLFDVYYEFVDDFNDQNFGITARLYYPPVRTECPNCYLNTMTGKSSNVYKAGGPISFSAGLCPYCGGEGLYETRQTEDIRMRYYANSDLGGNTRMGDFKVIVGGIVLAVGDGLTYGQLTDMPKIKRCEYAIMPLDQTGYETYKYQLLAEPALHGFRKNKYFKAVWKRIE